MTRVPAVTAVLAAGVGLLALGSGPSYAAGNPGCNTLQTKFDQVASVNLKRIGTPQSWGVASGAGVTVAVVDSGVNATNPHLKGAVLPGKSFVPGDGGDGRTDTFGHGTAVAGILAGRFLPSTGSALVGQAFGAQILPVRVFTNEPSSGEQPGPGDVLPRADLTAQGIRWAADRAKVINVSLSFKPTDVNLPAMRSAIEYAHRKGALVVAAAGDTTSDQTVDTTPRYPAALPDVLGVAAANGTGVVDDWSAQGDFVDVAAPGSNVLFTYQGLGDCVTPDSPPATSWATPFVSGLAAQVFQEYPHATPDQVAYRIEATADRGDAARRTPAEGWGLIQPYDALTAELDPRLPGPPVPGASAAPAVRPVSEGVAAVRPGHDPLVAVRRQSLWWILGAVGLAAVALVVRPLLLRRLSGR